MDASGSESGVFRVREKWKLREKTEVERVPDAAKNYRGKRAAGGLPGKTEELRATAK